VSPRLHLPLVEDGARYARVVVRTRVTMTHLLPRVCKGALGPILVLCAHPSWRSNHPLTPPTSQGGHPWSSIHPRGCRIDHHPLDATALAHHHSLGACSFMGLPEPPRLPVSSTSMAVHRPHGRQDRDVAHPPWISIHPSHKCNV
jgi:hypothetical protein